MLAKQAIKQVLIDQQNEIDKLLKATPVRREIEGTLKKALADHIIKVIIGVRRCGKSFLSHQVLRGKRYGYINFDDERLVGAQTEDLNNFLEVLEELFPDLQTILLDEIQNVDGWELFANRLKRNKYNLVITGSNSKLLSKELATHLTGRHMLFELFPFSFREFLQYHDVPIPAEGTLTTQQKGRMKHWMEEYMQKGGFPEVYTLQFRDRYLQDLYDRIISRDVVDRYSIRNTQSFKEVALYALSQFGSRMTYHKVKNIFDFKSVQTVKNYLGYLEEAYIVFQLQSFSFKPKERLSQPRKIYGIDTGLIHAVSSELSPNKGRLMENVVFLELKRRRQEVYFYNLDGQVEIDFVVKEGHKVTQLIQVSSDISDPDTKKREIRALRKGSTQLRCKEVCVITWDEESTETIDGLTIQYIPLYRWLIL